MFRNQKILLLNSQEEGKLPEDLENGELAVNNYAGHEFITLKNTANQFVKFTPNNGNTTGTTLNAPQPFNYVEGLSNAIVSDGNTATRDYTLTHGQWMRNESEYSFAMGAMMIPLQVISKGGAVIEVNKEYIPTLNSVYYDGAYIINEEGKKVTDIISVNYNGEKDKVTITTVDEINEKLHLYISLPSTAGGKCNFNFGINNLTFGEHNTVFGKGNTIYGDTNFVTGEKNDVEAINAIVFGNFNKSLSQSVTLTVGEKNTVSGGYSITSGKHNENVSTSGICVGEYLKNINPGQATFGTANEGDENLFVVGNGFIKDENTKDIQRHNALAIDAYGLIHIQEGPATYENGEMKYPPMVTIQSLIDRIKELEKKYTDLKAKYDDIHL
jgi:hypothetical protein